MTGVFISNFINHHQKPFYDALNSIMDGKCYFLQTMKMTDEVKNLGYHDGESPDYLLDASEMSFEEIMQNYGKLIYDADFVLLGDDDKYAAKRLKAGKLTFFIGERWCKTYPTGLNHLKKYHFLFHHSQ